MNIEELFSQEPYHCTIVIIYILMKVDRKEPDFHFHLKM